MIILIINLWTKILVNTGLFINNEFVEGSSTIETVNPSTGQVITAVQAGKIIYFYLTFYFLFYTHFNKPTTPPLLWRIEPIFFFDTKHIFSIFNFLAGEKEVDLAVAAAHKAYYGGWKTSNPRERARLMNKLADLVDRDMDELAHIETLDNGKPLTDAKSFDVPGLSGQL